MDDTYLAGKVCVLTGGGNGLGAAIADRMAAAGARLCIVDLDGDAAEHVAARAGGIGLQADITQPDYETAIITTVEAALGPVDIWFTNAGTGGANDFLSLTDAQWEGLWQLHVMSHVRACRAVLPGMLERKSGHLVQTASGVALAMQRTQADYTVTKHGALALNEWLHHAFSPRGISVSCFCPLGIKTDLMARAVPRDGWGQRAWASAISPEDAAKIVVQGICARQMLILSHPEILESVRQRANDHARWLRNPFPHLE